MRSFERPYPHRPAVLAGLTGPITSDNTFYLLRAKDGTSKTVKVKPTLPEIIAPLFFADLVSAVQLEWDQIEKKVLSTGCYATYDFSGGQHVFCAGRETYLVAPVVASTPSLDPRQNQGKYPRVGFDGN